MTLTSSIAPTETAEVSVFNWREPEGVAPRGTLIVVPGRGESPAIYERFGRRLAADAYRVHAILAPDENPHAATDLLGELLEAADPQLPRVIVGADGGAVFAASAVARSEVSNVSALVLAGLPTAPSASLNTVVPHWDSEIVIRTACSAHQKRIAAGGVRPAALFTDLPTEWFNPSVPFAIDVPVLGIHGLDDVVSPYPAAQQWYSNVPRGKLVGITGGRHDALNDQTHRSVAATIVLFLERLRLGAELAPIVVPDATVREKAIPERYSAR